MSTSTVVNKQNPFKPSQPSGQLANPFAFRVGDPQMQKENAAQYYPPNIRMEIRQYLSRSSVRFKQRPSGGERDQMCKS